MSEEIDYGKYAELLGSLQQLAMALGEYYRALLKEGFSEQNALYLTAQWQQHVLSMTAKGNKDE